MAGISGKDVRAFFRAFDVSKTIDISNNNDENAGWELRQKAHDVRCQLGGCTIDPATTELRELKDVPIRLKVAEHVAELAGASQYITDDDIAIALEEAGLLKLPKRETSVSLWQSLGSAKWAYLNNSSLSEFGEYLNANPTDEARRKALDIMEKKKETFLFDDALGQKTVLTAMLATKDPDIRERYLKLFHFDDFIHEHDGDKSLSNIKWHFGDIVPLLGTQDIPMFRRWVDGTNSKEAAFGLFFASYLTGLVEFESMRRRISDSSIASEQIYKCERWTTEEERKNGAEIATNFPVTLGEFAEAIYQSNTLAVR